MLNRCKDLKIIVFSTVAVCVLERSANKLMHDGDAECGCTWFRLPKHFCFSLLLCILFGFPAFIHFVSFILADLQGFARLNFGIESARV